MAGTRVWGLNPFAAAAAQGPLLPWLILSSSSPACLLLHHPAQGSPGALCTSPGPQRGLHIMGTLSGFGHHEVSRAICNMTWSLQVPLPWPFVLELSEGRSITSDWTKNDGGQEPQGNRERISPDFEGRQCSLAVDSICWHRLKRQDEVAQGRSSAALGQQREQHGSGGGRSLCHTQEKQCRGPLSGLLAEAAFPGMAPGRTMSAWAAEGSCWLLPPRKRTRWPRSCCSPSSSRLIYSPHGACWEVCPHHDAA